MKIRELEATNKEKEYYEVLHELDKCQADLTHAKTNMLGYVHSLNQLEDQIKMKLENGVALDENDEILRLKMENLRLNEENSSLLNSKQQVQQSLNSRVEQLQANLFVKTEQYAELSNKYSNLLTSLTTKREEEIKAWKRRQDLILNTIQELRVQLADTRNRRTQSLEMKDEEQKLVLDEVKLLRQEANKLQTFWETQFNEWVREKKSLRDEIVVLREKLKTVEDYYKEATDLRKEETSLLCEQRALMQEKENWFMKLVNDNEMRNQKLEEMQKEDSEFQQDKGEQVVGMLRQELQQQHHNVKVLQQVHSEEVGSLNQTFSEREKQLTEREGVLIYENQRIKKFLDQTNSAMDTQSQTSK